MVALIVLASILLVTVKLPSVPTVVINGWFPEVTVVLIVATFNAPDTVRLPINAFTALNDDEVVLPATVKFVKVPTVVMFGWLAVVILELIVADWILFVTVKLPNVPSVVMNGWFADVIVALMVATSSAPDTVRLPINAFTTLSDAEVVLPATVKFVKVPTVVISG